MRVEIEISDEAPEHFTAAGHGEPVVAFPCGHKNPNGLIPAVAAALEKDTDTKGDNG